jgi:hypothetical protein
LWGHCGHGERWFPCLGLPPLLLWRCARGGPLPYTAGAPDQGADRIGFPIYRPGDHFPNILPLDLHILSLLRHQLIHKSVHRAHYIMTVSYVLSDTMTTIHLSVSKRFLSRPLYIQNHRLSLKPMPAKCFLNTLGGKPFISGSAIIFLVLICSRLIV